jgi:hypothetical protein
VRGAPAKAMLASRSCLCACNLQLGFRTKILPIDVGLGVPSNAVRDADIRRALLGTLHASHGHDGDTCIVEEMGLRQGLARVDVAVVNGVMHGYEIKSLADTLRRLPAQVDLYGQVLDFVTIVLAEQHRDEAHGLIPRWWGVWIAKPAAHAIDFVERRRPRKNPSLNTRSLVELLWHQEALAMLQARGASSGLSRRPRAEAWTRLCEVYSVNELRDAVRARIKDRRSSPSPR